MDVVSNTTALKNVIVSIICRPLIYIAPTSQVQIRICMSQGIKKRNNIITSCQVVETMHDICRSVIKILILMYNTPSLCIFGTIRI